MNELTIKPNKKNLLEIIADTAFGLRKYDYPIRCHDHYSDIAKIGMRKRAKRLDKGLEKLSQETLDERTDELRALMSGTPLWDYSEQGEQHEAYLNKSILVNFVSEYQVGPATSLKYLTTALEQSHSNIGLSWAIGYAHGWKELHDLDEWEHEHSVKHTYLVDEKRGIDFGVYSQHEPVEADLWIVAARLANKLGLDSDEYYEKAKTLVDSAGSRIGGIGFFCGLSEEIASEPRSRKSADACYLREDLLEKEYEN